MRHRKEFLTHRQSKLAKTLREGHGEPSQRKAAGTNPTMKVLDQSYHIVLDLPQRRTLKEDHSCKSWLGNAPYTLKSALFFTDWSNKYVLWKRYANGGEYN